MKLAGDTTHLPDPQHQLHYTFEFRLGQALAQVEAYIMPDSSNLTDD
jgi:hypothetical protein